MASSEVRWKVTWWCRKRIQADRLSSTNVQNTILRKKILSLRKSEPRLEITYPGPEGLQGAT